MTSNHQPLRLASRWAKHDKVNDYKNQKIYWMHTFITPSEFYRQQRPENFSDSKVIANIIMPKEQLAFELSMISTNQKHDLFEDMCRRVAEKLISPNLIPQVGPTGGGDGKTDSETYPVSNFISERWYIGQNKWNENENWAFAISAKEDWNSKVKADVKKIVETRRGYTKIFFFSSRNISSRNKKDTQDQLKSEYNIDVVILDAVWLVDKVYSNNLLNDVIESLNLSRSYLEEKIIGPNDAERISQLKELEERINSYDRNLEVDHHLVEDCLESAMLARSLELPRIEVFGRYERAKRFADKLGNIQLVIRVVYQKAWTLINYYDEYKEFYSIYIKLKPLVKDNATLNSIELYFNLFNMIRTISSIPEVKEIVEIDFNKERDEFFQLLTLCSQDEVKHTTALLSKFYISFINIFNALESDKPVSNELVKLTFLFEKSRNYLEIPFEQLRDITKKFGLILPESTHYDDLLDVIAQIESIRVSELSSGKLYMERGITKLENDLGRASLVYFGKAARKLAKEESKIDFYYCLMLLSDAYKRVGLYWASYNALVAGASIYSRKLFDTGFLDIKFLRSVEAILKNEMIVGRIPIILCWYELYNLLKLQFKSEELTHGREDEIPIEHLVDMCLGVRLLNEPFNKFENFSLLPDILNQQGLWMSADAVLYLLGHEDKIDIDEKTRDLLTNDFEKHYNKFANQPFVEQILYDTDLLNSNSVFIRSNVLGLRINIQILPRSELMLLGELLLAYLESYLATAFNQAIAAVETASIELRYTDIIDGFNLTIDENNYYKISINESLNLINSEVLNIINTLIPQLISRCYVLKDIGSFFEENYVKDEIQERLSIVLEHKGFLNNLLSSKPKFFLSDWKNEDTKHYRLNRKSSPILIDNKENESNKGSFDYDKITHSKIRSETIIDIHLWDEARWRGVGFLSMQGIPFGIFLAFENAQAGEKIFKNWIQKFGDTDSEEKISITIIKGINKNNPFWYKVLISKSIDSKLKQDGNLISMASRFHRMDAKNGDNLKNLIDGYNHFNKYYLIPAGIDEDLSLKPFPHLKILKHNLTVVNAWEIGINDLERVVITSDDDPIIPIGVENAPIEEVIRLNRNNE